MDYEEIAILKKERKKKGYDSLDGIILVMNRRGGTCQVINLIHHIMPQELEPGIPEMVHQILPPPGEEDVDDDDIVPPLQQLVHQVIPTNPAPVTMIRRGCRRPELWQVGGEGEAEEGRLEEEEGGGDEDADEDEEAALLF